LRAGTVIGVFVRVLGALTVEAGEPSSPLVIAGAKERTLLGRLLVSLGDTVAVDVLVEDLWDGAPPPSARKSLQAFVVRVRSALEPDRPTGSPGRYVVRRGDGYALTVPADSVDVRVAAVAAAQARAALTVGEPRQARQRAVEALELWRGEPWADWRDAPWAQAERVRAADLRVGLLEVRLDADLALGTHREVLGELESLTAAEPLREGWWTRLMLALYRCDRQADALAAGRRARAVLAEELGVEPGPGLRRMEQSILEQSAELDVPRSTLTVFATPTGTSESVGEGAPVGSGAGAQASRPASADCPYRGLAAYGTQDADMFFGRGAAVRALVARAATRTLVVVAGPSGAGKSSLVRAGLLPALSRGELPGSASWQHMVITPGNRPVDELSSLMLTQQSGDATADVYTADDAGSTGATKRQPVVLVVDQFEELWTAGADPGERQAFLDTLLTLHQDGLAARIVLAVRGDHLGRLAEHPVLAEQAADGLVLVPPLTEPEIREVVGEPAALAGLSVDPDLVDVVVRDLHGQPAALPLLSTALVATWERRRGDTLTLAGYLEAGGVTGALARTAETALAGLDADAAAAARRVLVRLAAEGEGGVPVRRRAALPELGLDGPEGAARRAAVEAFVSRRLLTIDADQLEVTHEALLTAWPRLVGWLAEDAAGRTVRTHLSPEARDWDAAGRPDDRLYRGARLAAAQDWLDRPDADPTDLERDFITASTAHGQAELDQARAQTRREQAGRRRTRRLATVLAAAVVLTVVTAGLALVGQTQARDNAARAEANAARADVNATVADANRLAAASANAPSLDTALLLAVQAYRIKDTPQTRDGLLGAVVANRQVSHVYPTTGIARRIALSPDARTLYVHAEEQVVAVDRITGTSTTLATYTGLAPYPTDVDASPTQGTASDGLIALVTPPTASRPGSSQVSLIEPGGTTRWTRSALDLGGWPITAEFQTDGARVVVTVLDDYKGGHPVMRYLALDVRSGTASSIGVPATMLPTDFYYDPWPSTVSDDAQSVMIAEPGGPAGRPGVVATAGGGTTWLDPPGHNTLGSAFIPVSGGALEVAEDGAMYWYPTGSSRWTQKLVAHTSNVIAAATNRAGTLLATGGYDRQVVVHRLRNGIWEQSDVLTGHQGAIREITISPDGSRVFAAGEDRTVVEWELTDTERFGTLIPELVSPVDPDSGSVITGAAAVAGDPPTWVVPVAVATDNVTHWHAAAAFLDPTTSAVRDWVTIEAPPLTTIPFAAASVAPGGRVVAVTAQFATVVLDARTHRPISTIKLDDVDGGPLGIEVKVPEPVSSVAWNQDGSRMFLGAGIDGKGAVVVINARTWKQERRILDGASVNVLASTPDGRLVAAGDSVGRVSLIDTTTLDVLGSLTGHGGVRGLAFSPDGTRLAAVGEGKRLDVWTINDRRSLYDQPPYVTGGGSDVRWLQDNTTIVYAGDDGRAVLFDAPTGRPRSVPLPVFRDSGGGLVYSAPALGNRLALLPGARVGLATREGVIYSLDPPDWIARACDITGRDLTASEWAQYLPERPRSPTCSDLLTPPK
jgi:DNA-binding SARP family transcriptional activator/WD40 repeat protein